jgi:hypothetical protein
MVDPKKKKKAVIMDPSALGNMMGAIGASGMVKMDVKDVKVSVEKLGAGERLLGYPTTRYRTTRGVARQGALRGPGRLRSHGHEGADVRAERRDERRRLTARRRTGRGVRRAR